jgi:hypothetical protein
MGVLEALGLGVIGQGLVADRGLFVCWATVPRTLVGILGGVPAGAMLSAERGWP